MLLYTHFIFPFAIALILTKLDILSLKLAILCGMIGVLIDLDHYIEHILHARTKRFSLKEAWNNSMKFHTFRQRSLIHCWQGAFILTLSFLILMLFNWKIALLLGISYYSHLFLDYIHLNREKILKWKINRIYFRESSLEIILDLISVITIIVILILW